MNTLVELFPNDIYYDENLDGDIMISETIADPIRIHQLYTQYINYFNACRVHNSMSDDYN